MTRLRAIAAVVFLATTGAAADVPAVFVTSPVEGKPVRGPLVALDDSWNLRLGEQPVKSSEWISLRREGVPLPAFPDDCHLVLTNGDRIRVRASSLFLQRDRLVFIAPGLGGGKPASANLSAIALIWRSPPEEMDDAFSFVRRLLATKRQRDTVILRNGDHVEGIVARLDRERLEIDVQRKRTRIDMPQVSAIIPSGNLAAPLIPKGASGRVVLSDGSRFAFRGAKLDGTTLQGTTLLGPAFTVEVGEIVRLDLRDEKYVPMSFLKPSRYQHTPYLGVSWALGVHGNVAGQALRLDGSFFDRGLGMHSASQVTFALPPGMRFFDSLVGLDEVTGRNGSVRVRVLVDGKEQDIGLKDDLRPGVVLPVRVGVKGARELTLVVDFGEGGDVGDHVNWVDPRLIR
jgi:hypothetical protein